MPRFSVRCPGWRRLAGAAALCLCAAGAAVAKPTVALCFEREQVPPWRDQHGGGLNFELLKLVAERADIVFEFHSMPWKRCLAQLGANQMGGAFSVSHLAQRQAVGAYPGGARVDPAKRMHTGRYVLVRRKGARIDWDGHTVSHLDGAVGVQLGYSVAEFLRARGVAVDEGSQRAGELIEKLLAGRVEAAAIGSGDAGALLASPLAGQVEVLALPLIEKPYYLVLSHALVAAQPALARRIWNAVEQARNSAAYRKLLRAAPGATD